jgi:hypothetical protein
MHGCNFAHWSCGAIGFDRLAALFCCVDHVTTSSEGGKTMNTYQYQNSTCSAKKSRQGCDAIKQPSGNCVVCKRRLEQCECEILMNMSLVKPLGEEAPFTSLVCSPATCTSPSCGGCSRCIHHCICKWTNKESQAGSQATSERLCSSVSRGFLKIPLRPNVCRARLRSLPILPRR